MIHESGSKSLDRKLLDLNRGPDLSLVFSLVLAVCKTAFLAEFTDCKTGQRAKIEGCPGKNNGLQGVQTGMA